MKALIEKSDLCNVHELPVSLKVLINVKNFLPKFEAAQSYYTDCYARQSKYAVKYLADTRSARLFISHFIQVLNLAIIRSEIKASCRSMYGLPDNNSLPDLASEASLIKWGENIIEGERKRVGHGGIPIYNPSIAKVKVRYDIFRDSYKKYKEIQASTTRSLEMLAAMRPEADSLILEAWNQIENKFEKVVPNEKRIDICREFGLVYYYRTYEKPE